MWMSNSIASRRRSCNKGTEAACQLSHTCHGRAQHGLFCVHHQHIGIRSLTCSSGRLNNTDGDGVDIMRHQAAQRTVNEQKAVLANLSIYLDLFIPCIHLYPPSLPPNCTIQSSLYPSIHPSIHPPILTSRHSSIQSALHSSISLSLPACLSVCLSVCHKPALAPAR